MGIITSSILTFASKKLFEKAKKEKMEYEMAIEDEKTQQALAQYYIDQTQKISDSYLRSQESLEQLLSGTALNGERGDFMPGVIFGGILKLSEYWGSSLTRNSIAIATNIEDRCGRFELTLINNSEYDYKIGVLLVDNIERIGGYDEKATDAEKKEKKYPKLKLLYNFIYGKFIVTYRDISYDLFGILKLKLGEYVYNIAEDLKKFELKAYQTKTLKLSIDTSMFKWWLAEYKDTPEYTNQYHAYAKAGLEDKQEIKFNLYLMYTVTSRNNNILQQGQWIPFAQENIKGVISYT